MKRLFVAAAASLMATNAMAADLGGACCADLEERIADLEATTARKGNRKVSLTIYGQVSKAIMWHSVEGDTDWRVADNGLAQSRVGFKGEAKISPDAKAGYILEIGVGENDGVKSSDDAFTVRHSVFFIEHKNIGRVWIGQTSMATDGISNISTANIGDVTHTLKISPWNGLFGFDLPFNGSRQQVVRYDTPTIGGFYVSAAMGNDENWDAALRYAGELGGFRIAAGVGFRNDKGAAALGVPSFDPAGDQQTLATSASIMHLASGVFFDAAYGRTQDWRLPSDLFGNVIPAGFALDMLTGYHARAGIETKLFGDVGKTTLFGGYGWFDVKDKDSVPLVTGIDPKIYEIGVVQAVDAAALNLYVHWRRTDIGLPSAADDDVIDTVIGGATIRF